MTAFHDLGAAVEINKMNRYVITSNCNNNSSAALYVPCRFDEINIVVEHYRSAIRVFCPISQQLIQLTLRK